jgi:small RNA 2'-O-methyltransferase
MRSRSSSGSEERRRRTREQLSGETSRLHEERLDAVVRHLRKNGCRSVVDLGCGGGALLERLLAEPTITRLVGIDLSLESLAAAEQRLRGQTGSGDRLSLRHGSVTEPHPDLTGFDAATLVETIEHLPPAHLSRLEHAVFVGMQPRVVVLTTPNREYNELLGTPAGALRHPDHKFEWDRARFRSWATGVARRTGYRVVFEAIGAGNAWLGSPTQLARFLLDAGTDSRLPSDPPDVAALAADAVEAAQRLAAER